MDSIAILLFVVSAINLALAGLVFWRSPKAEINRVFAITALSVAAWTVTNALFQATASVAAATRWANLSYVSALIVAASLFHFSQIYPAHGDQPQRRLSSWAARGLWLAAILCCIAPFLPHFVIARGELVPERRIFTNPGLYLLAAFIFATVLGALRALLRSLVVTRGRERMQARYVLTGMALTATCGLLCNLVLPLTGQYALVWLGPASSLLFVGSTVYSIIRERLFDIRIIIHRSLVYGLLLALISGAYSAIELGLTDVLQRSAPGDQHPLLANIGGAVLVSLCVHPVRQWLERQLDRLIFKRGRGHKHQGHRHPHS